jgi:hypothetical protein
MNSRLHTLNNFSENYQQFGCPPSKMLASPSLGQKSLKNNAMKGCEIINLPGMPTCLGPALDKIKVTSSHTINRLPTSLSHEI